MPLNHPCLWDVPLSTYHFGVSPFVKTATWTHSTHGPVFVDHGRNGLQLGPRLPNMVTDTPVHLAFSCKPTTPNTSTNLP